MENTVEIDYEDILPIIAERLKMVREAKGLSQIDISNILKTAQANYSRMEHGLRDMRLLNLYYIAAHLGININWLFGLSSQMYDNNTEQFHKRLVEKKANLPKRIRKS